jgi:DNA-dependent protein kinase catalytic subunit
MALLEAVITALGSASHAEMREFCASSVAEFLKWSLKHQTRKQAEKNPFNVKSLFKRLIDLAHHPDPMKRMGCAVALSKFYPILKAEDSVADVFLLELLHNAIFSLRLAEKDEPSLGTLGLESFALSHRTPGTADAIAKAVAELGHLVVKRAVLLSKPNRLRRSHPDLGDFVRWLCTETTRLETRSRRECIALFTKLVPSLGQLLTPARWLQKRVQAEGLPAVLQSFELRMPALDPRGFASVSAFRDFLLALLANLEITQWLISEVGLGSSVFPHSSASPRAWSTDLRC